MIPYEVLFNPYLLLIVGLGWAWLIISKTKLHWKIIDRISLWKIIHKLNETELKEWQKDNGIMMDIEMKVSRKYDKRTLMMRKMLNKRQNELHSDLKVRQE